jgi:hypothetical protein
MAIVMTNFIVMKLFLAIAMDNGWFLECGWVGPKGTVL